MRRNGFGRLGLQSDRAHGLVFDGVIILANFYTLRSLLAVPLEAFSEPRIGTLLAIGVLTHLSGALLKRGPLQYRIRESESGKTKLRQQVMGCLSFIHFLFFLVVIVMSAALLGLVDLDNSSELKQSLWIIISFIVAGIISITVWKSVSNSGNETGGEIGWPYQEVVANILLGISAAILTRFFWTGLLLESEPPSYMGISGRAFVLVAAASALFVVFYVPSRLLFLAEDYKYPTTWIRLWLVAMLPLLIILFIK